MAFEPVEYLVLDVGWNAGPGVLHHDPATEVHGLHGHADGAAPDGQRAFHQLLDAPLRRRYQVGAEHVLERPARLRALRAVRRQAADARSDPRCRIALGLILALAAAAEQAAQTDPDLRFVLAETVLAADQAGARPMA